MNITQQINLLFKERYNIFYHFIKEFYPSIFPKIKPLNITHHAFHRKEWFENIRNIPVRYNLSSDIIHKWYLLVRKLTYKINYQIILKFIEENNLEQKLLKKRCYQNKFKSIDELIYYFLIESYSADSPYNFFFNMFTWDYTDEGYYFWCTMHQKFTKKMYNV